MQRGWYLKPNTCDGYNPFGSVPRCIHAEFVHISVPAKHLIISGKSGLRKRNSGRRLCSFWKDRCFALVVPTDLFSLVLEMLVLPPDPPTVDLFAWCLAERLLQTSLCVSLVPQVLCQARCGRGECNGRPEDASFSPGLFLSVCVLL